MLFYTAHITLHYFFTLWYDFKFDPKSVRVRKEVSDFYRKYEEDFAPPKCELLTISNVEEPDDDTNNDTNSDTNNDGSAEENNDKTSASLIEVCLLIVSWFVSRSDLV